MREALVQEESFPKRGAKILFGIAWPLIAWSRCIQESQKHSSWSSKASLSQFFKQWLTAVWYSLPPSEYARFSNVLRSDRSFARLIATTQERAYLVNILNRGVERTRLLDKFVFFSVCRDNNIPTVPVVSYSLDGEVSWPSPNIAISPESLSFDLIGKPCEGQKGEGVILWLWKGNGTFETPEGQPINRNDLVKYVKYTTAEGGGFIIQPRLVNHPLIKKFSPGCLSTVRILTGIDVAGEVTPLQAVLRIGAKGSIVDNFNAGGLAAPICIESGMLGEFISKASEAERSLGTFYPEDAEGTVVPYWGRVLEFCVEAHSVFSEYTFIGWDVAILEGGPVLVEANDHPSVDFLQSAGRNPLGLTKFYQIADDQLDYLRRL